MKIENPSSFTYEDDARFELQWAQSASSCRNGLTWNAMDSSGSAFEMFDSAFISPNGESSATQLLSNLSANTHVLSE